MKIRLKKLPLLLSVIILLTKISFSQQIGANFNENIEEINSVLLSKAEVNWVRGFVNIPREFLNISKEGKIVGVNSRAIKEFDTSYLTNLTAHNIILSLKLDFKFRNIGVPETNSQEEQYVINAIDQFLTEKNLGSKIHILVVGNEPMWETPKDDAEKLGQFTNKLITRVNKKKELNHWNYEIFTGAVNRISELKKNEIAAEILKITKENPLVNGIDLHIHTNDLKKVSEDLAYIRTEQKIDKKVICTEFSLVRLYEQHINDRLGDWGEKNGFNKDMRLYQWLNLLKQKATKGSPISQSMFNDFFEQQDWYPKQWFNTFLAAFEDANVTVATYGLQNKLDDGKTLNPESQLWILNFVFNASLFGVDKQGSGNTNPLVYPEFIK